MTPSTHSTLSARSPLGRQMRALCGSRLDAAPLAKSPSRAAPSGDALPVGRGTYLGRSSANAIGRDVGASRHRDLVRKGCNPSAVYGRRSHEGLGGVWVVPRGGSEGPSTRGVFDHPLYLQFALNLHVPPSVEVNS